MTPNQDEISQAVNKSTAPMPSNSAMVCALLAALCSFFLVSFKKGVKGGKDLL